MGAKEFLQKFSLHVDLIPNGSLPQRVEPDFSLVLQSQRKELQPHQIHIGDVLFEGIAYFLEFPDVRVWIFTLHSMESGEQGHNVGLDNYVFWRRHNVGGCTHSRGVYMIPHSSVCIGISLCVGSIVPRVEAPSDHCSSSLHSSILVEH